MQEYLMPVVKYVKVTAKNKSEAYEKVRLEGLEVAGFVKWVGDTNDIYI